MVTKASELRANARPIDPDVKVPQAVIRAREAAERAQAQAYPDQNPPAPDATPPKDGITIIENPPQEVIKEAPKEPTPVTPESNPPPTNNDETWEHKFNSERGRRLRAEQLLEQTTSRLNSLESLVAELQAQPKVVAAATPTLKERLITAQEETEFGTEMLDVMGRRAREIVTPEVAELRAQLAALENKITGTTQTVARNARQDMLATLDTRMPEWRRVNDLTEFKAWLALPDPYFGVIRHGELLKAYAQNDTPRVLQFFKGFVSELAATTPVEPLIPSATPPAQQPDKPGLETLAAPGRARTPAPQQAPVEKQIITTADINAFYAAKAKGAYAGREALADELEQELFLAQREGRVRAV